MFLKTVLLITVWTARFCGKSLAESEVDMSVQITSDPSATGPINHSDEIVHAEPTAADHIGVNLASNMGTKPAAKHLELVFSKFGPLGSLFLSVNKWRRKDYVSNVPYPVPYPPFPIQQDAQLAQPSAASPASSSVIQQQDPIFGPNVFQPNYPQYHAYYPSFDLSIKAPPIPNVQPLINAFPELLKSKYKSLLDKLSTTSLVWDKVVKFPFFHIKNTGLVGSSATGPVSMVHGAQDLHSGHIDTLIDIRNPSIS